MSVIRAPYSLGKLIDWKHWLDSAMQHRSTKTPYSLGKLIDWKRFLRYCDRFRECFPPYSLGKLIDWKPPKFGGCSKGINCQLPTR